MSLDVQMLTVGPVAENCFIVRREGSERALVVDPGEEPERILAALEEQGLKAEAILAHPLPFRPHRRGQPGRRGDRRHRLLPGDRGPRARRHHGLRTLAGFGPYESYEADETVAGGEAWSWPASSSR